MLEPATGVLGTESKGLRWFVVRRGCRMSPVERISHHHPTANNMVQVLTPRLWQVHVNLLCACVFLLRLC